MRKTWLHYAKWSKRPKFKPAWSIKTPRKRSPVECNFDHVSHSGLFLGKSLCYWDILWTTLEHYIDGTMVHELDTANNYFCIYEKIKFAPFFLAHPVWTSLLKNRWRTQYILCQDGSKIIPFLSIIDLFSLIFCIVCVPMCNWVLYFSQKLCSCKNHCIKGSIFKFL